MDTNTKPAPTGTSRRGHPLLKTFARFLLLDIIFDRRARPVFVYVAANIVVGTYLYHWLEGWGVLDSAYFVIITLTTIGYGDFSPSTPLTKILTIFYALNGVAILLMLLDEIRRVRQETLADADDKQ
ncbi:MAG: hypothetical protein Kow0031_15970 [Anaerolineae bacterium]